MIRILVPTILLLLMGMSYATILANQLRRPFRRKFFPFLVSGAAAILLAAYIAADVMMPESVVGRANTFKACLLSATGGALTPFLIAALGAVGTRIDLQLRLRPIAAEIVPDEVKVLVCSRFTGNRLPRDFAWLVFDSHGDECFVAYRAGGAIAGLLYRGGAESDSAGSVSRWGVLASRAASSGIGTLIDGRKRDISVANGVWWVFAPGEDGWRRFEFFNRSGRGVYWLQVRHQRSE